MNLSERIKNIRKEKGLTQKELAEKAGLSIASIQGYEQGKYKPKIEQLEKLSAALECSLYDLTQHTKTNYTLTDLKALKTAISKDSHSMQQLRSDALLSLFHTLNPNGQDQAIDQVELLTKIPEYRKDTEEQL